MSVDGARELRGPFSDEGKLQNLDFFFVGHWVLKLAGFGNGNGVGCPILVGEVVKEICCGFGIVFAENGVMLVWVLTIENGA